jgi:hypothetical protein
MTVHPVSSKEERAVTIRMLSPTRTELPIGAAHAADLRSLLDPEQAFGYGDSGMDREMLHRGAALGGAIIVTVAALGAAGFLGDDRRLVRVAHHVATADFSSVLAGTTTAPA